MLNVSNMIGLASLMITSSLTTFPFCEIYQSMKRVNENQVISLKSLLMTLFQFIMWMLYSYNNDINDSNSDYYMLITFTYSTFIYLLYFNMYLFSINRKNNMLICTLIIVSLIYIINKIFNPLFIGLCGITITILDKIMSLRNVRFCVLNKNVTRIDFSKVFGYFFMSFFWWLYALVNSKWCFAWGNSLTIVNRLIEGIVFYWGIGKIVENSMLIRIVKLLLLIKHDYSNNENGDNKEKELIQLKEDSIIQQPPV